MWAFQYKHGDRPLEGYTIQRAAGRGGFGEVYYALSDSGREVALKAVQGYEQIELRGISQCMNLKSPHLVSIFDVRHNHEGKPFVIMEYVSGLNLRQLLDESPAGLGTQKAAFFLREIAKGLSFLHECGIVHRDLKPANIFYENGYVKIGDYGLSKHITTSQYSGQTVTVGTVHYMAPEIGAGKYDRGIDIYALGAVLFEMLTGTPPYLGASPSEVLMKHLSSEPDVSGIPQPFARVIRKAMARDPNQRYQTVQEMVEDVFGAEHVRQSVSVFSTEDLSVIADRVAKKATATVGAGAGGAGPGQGPGSSAPVAQPDAWGRIGTWMDEVGGRVFQMWNEPPNPGAPAAQAAPADAPGAAAPMPLVVNDPLPNRHRWQLAILVSVLAPLAAMLVAPRAAGNPAVALLFVFTAMWGAAVGLFIAHRSILPRMGSDSVWVQRLITGQMTAVGSVLFSLPIWVTGDIPEMGATLFAVLAPYFVFDSLDEVKPDREERVQFGHLFGAGLVAFILCMIFGGHTQLAIATGAGLALIVQILSPWDPIAAARTKAAKAAEEGEDEEEEDDDETSGTPAGRKFGMAIGIGIDPATGEARQIPLEGLPASAADDVEGEQTRYWSRPVWRFAPLAWVFGIIVFGTLGVMFCVYGGMTEHRDETGPFVGAGVVALLLFVLCVFRSFSRTFYGWWGYLIKPLLMTLCAGAICASATVTGNLTYRISAEELMIGLFFIVFPSILLLVLLFIPGRTRLQDVQVTAVRRAGASRFKRSWALVLCAALFFIGAAGLHRFYVGRVKSGILWLVTFGLLFVGQIVDLIMILSGNFTDAKGRPVLRWDPDAPARPEPVESAVGLQEAVRNVEDAIKQVTRGIEPVAARVAATPVRAAAAARRAGQTAYSSYASGRSHVQGLLSALAGLLIFVSTIAALGIALDVPGMIAAGLPTPEVRADLEADVFTDYPDWPVLMRKVGAGAVGVVMLVALTVLVFARQNGGVMHMIRGIVGSSGLMVAMVPLSDTVARRASWADIAALVHQNKMGPAVDQFLQAFQTRQALLAACIFLVSVIVLAWPPRVRVHQVGPQPAKAG